MARNVRLHEYIGKIINVIEPDAYTSVAIAASDNQNTVPIEGCDGVLFVATIGDLVGTGTAHFQIQYSSTGLASDAVTSNAGMTCTDAIFSIDSDDENAISLLDFNVRAKGLTDGVLCVSMAVPAKGGDYGLIAIPYGGNFRLPVTQENTIVSADARV